eukprot:6201952-Pleurochrysis_carterae.AAC.5
MTLIVLQMKLLEPEHWKSPIGWRSASSSALRDGSESSEKRCIGVEELKTLTFREELERDEMPPPRAIEYRRFAHRSCLEL